MMIVAILIIVIIKIILNKSVVVEELRLSPVHARKQLRHKK